MPAREAARTPVSAATLVPRVSVPTATSDDDVPVVTSLAPDLATALRAAPFTYPALGSTADPPAGYRRLARTWTLPRADFEQAGERLMSWQAHEGAGLRVAASSPHAEAGAVVLMRLGPGPVALRIPCRVLYVVDEPDRTGFSYGTLPGHPVAGQELFRVDRDGRGGVTFTVEAVSTPATTLMRLGGPVARWAQDRMMDRYRRALDRDRDVPGS